MSITSKTKKTITLTMDRNSICLTQQTVGTMHTGVSGLIDSALGYIRESAIPNTILTGCSYDKNTLTLLSESDTTSQF